MNVRHELRFTKRCPVNDAIDQYEAILETNQVVEVEKILACVAALPDKAFQEQLTQELSLKTGCRVTTVCYHSGVKTTCIV